MNRALTYISFIDMVFILFLALAGTSGTVFYYLAFIVPLLIAFVLKGNVKTEPLTLKISGRNLALAIPTVAPTLATVFLLSFLTSLILSFIGEGSAPDVSGNILLVILRYAVATAVLEEALFRYVPLAFLSPHSKKGAVIISAAFFAFAHCDLYQIPYAFFAGIIFASLDIATSSVWPSVIIHFLNNLISVIWLRYGGSTEFSITYAGILALCAFISVLVMIKHRQKYKTLFSPILFDKSKYKLSYAPALFAAVTLIIAITNLFGGAL